MGIQDRAQEFTLRTWTFTPAGLASGRSISISATFAMDETTARLRLAARGTPVDGWAGRFEDSPVEVDEPAPEGKKRFLVSMSRKSEAEVEVYAADEDEARQEAVDSDPDWDNEIQIESVKEIK
jgi:hypothetical protein